MSTGIYTALSGAIAQERALDVVANNVANASTTGFRADRLSFQEVLSPNTSNDPAVVSPTRYVAATATVTDNTIGAMRQTGNPLDIAIQGDGFFAVNTPAGERYTRAGAFLRNADGELITPAGYTVQDASSREIVIPAGATVDIGADGTVTANGDQVGQIRIVQFDNPNQSLAKEGLTFFAAQGGAQPRAAEDATLVQGHLETSNINAVQGMTQLITVSRSFDILQKVIDAFRQMDDRAAREIGRR